MLLRTLQRASTVRLASAAPLRPSLASAQTTVRYIFSSAAKKKDPYNLLNVPRTATAKDIKLAYFREAKKCHPDLNPNDAQATIKFRGLTEAYEILSDPTRRAELDSAGSSSRFWQQTSSPPPPHHEEEVFSSVLGDATIVKDAFQLYVRDLHGEFVFARESAARGEWRNVWQVVVKRKGLVFGLSRDRKARKPTPRQSRRRKS
ncbi:hypothetical protein SPRG_19113 [Saprolegnia parasitica CBS 223.65]|uniref:J domain-containing protein n=1 Tax=Saprolegnia parasitica (strain CBS 223.65) TaxID=695850 RepID=A0A067CYG5_SAPPC|nr:hypothetical protein SPRG_19113 [Saprolegnia parasitica CBS 223.65]KDO34295.1 hypothetical protein SPRG_19113 [Saprolegnia parasitica CBS 223.65]|eukprot:XP_012195306.1 hypothetical protein SPRG_19113 [Saprolegnia parasitica CBS 223.65]